MPSRVEDGGDEVLATASHLLRELRIFAMRKSRSNGGAVKKAESLGHKMSEFSQYGDREYSYCERPACKAHLVENGAEVGGNAIAHLCPLTEGIGWN